MVKGKNCFIVVKYIYIAKNESFEPFLSVQFGGRKYPDGFLKFAFNFRGRRR